MSTVGRTSLSRPAWGFWLIRQPMHKMMRAKAQIAMLPAQRLRDFRFVLGGSFPSLSRKVTYNVGIMYDGPSHSWLMRQTGVMIAVPKLWGNIFIGRSKGGAPLNKVMVGYDGWTMERSTMSDATIPILADGFKWLGYTPKHGFDGTLAITTTGSLTSKTSLPITIRPFCA